MVYGVSGDSYNDLKALRNAGIIDCHFIIHGGGSAPPSGFVADCNAAGVSPVLNNGNDGGAGWNGSDSYNANVAAMGFHAVGGESEQADEIDSIMNHLIFLDYGGEGTAGNIQDGLKTNDCVWCATHPAPVHGFGAASYMETYDGSSNLWGWDVMSQGMLSAKAHGVKEIGLCVGTWMINHSSAQDYINIAQQMEANGVTCAGMVVWGGYGSDMNSVYNEFASWFQAWMAAYPPTNVTMKNRFAGPTPTPTPSSITFTSSPAACSIDVNTLDIFAAGSDNALWHKRWTSFPPTAATTAAGFTNGWTPWDSLGGITTSAPAAVARDGGLDVFVRGTTGALWYKRWAGTWSEWTNLGGVILKGTAPTADSRGPTVLDVFVIGTTGALWQRTLTGTTWSQWIEVDSVIQ